MGREAKSFIFNAADEAEFIRLVGEETKQLFAWAQEERMASPVLHLGQEIEFCLIDQNFLPSSINEKFLNRLASPQATHELAAFNVEFNPGKAPFAPGGLMQMRYDYVKFMQHAFTVAESLGVHLITVGILPTISPGDLGSKMMTHNNRYEALKRKFSSWQPDKAFNLISITENDGLQLGLSPLACEAVTTSQQVHLQLPEPGSGFFYNAAQILAGPLVALSANSPFFLGRNLWCETRVPVFEQVLGARFLSPAGKKNDIFGAHYVEHSILELFADNLENYVVALPDIQPSDNQLANMGLHNGTIWRWNRPVFAYDETGPTLRLEVRVMPSGTTNNDMIANIAFLAGAIRGLVAEVIGDAPGSALEKMLPFADVRDNFYTCARDGLDAKIRWFGGKTLPVQQVLLDELLPLARRELNNRQLNEDEIAYLDIVHDRTDSGINGAAYQRAFARKHGLGSSSIRGLTGSYWRRQLQGMPVHKWTL